MENKDKVECKKTRIQFVKEGQKGQKNCQEENYHYLSAAKDWTLRVDVDTNLKIPSDICQTNLGPDIIMVSKKSKQLGVIELTVPSEDRVEISGELKRLKYEQIVQEGRQNGWKVRVWAVEVGCRGFPAMLMSTLMKDLGYKGGERKKAIERIGKVVARMSERLVLCTH